MSVWASDTQSMTPGDPVDDDVSSISSEEPTPSDDEAFDAWITSQIERQEGEERMWELWKKTRPSENLLLKLPAELRVMIYKAYFEIEQRTTWWQRKGGRREWPVYRKEPVCMKYGRSRRHKWPAIFQVSSQVRAEASAVYFSGKSFVLKCRVQHLERVGELMDRISPKWIMSRDGNARCPRFEVRLVGRKSMPIADFVGYLEHVSLWSMEEAAVKVTGNKGAERHIREAEWLGERMRSEGRDDAWLDTQYDEWVKRLSFHSAIGSRGAS